MWSKISEKPKYINNQGLTFKGTAQYLCEAEADVASLPTTNVAIGSSAIVIVTGSTYILGPSRKWLKYNGVAILNDTENTGI